QKVDLLVLIDPTPPAHLIKLVRDVISRFGNLIKLSQDKQVDWFLRLRHALRHMYRYLHSSNDKRLQDFDQLITVDPRLDSMLPPTEALRHDWVGVFTWMVAGYAPHLYPGKVTLFWASEEPFRGAWRRKMAKNKEIEFHVIPGTHRTCITEHVHVLAESLSV